MAGIVEGLFMEEFMPPRDDIYFSDRIILKIAIISTLVLHTVPVLCNPAYMPELTISTLHYVYYAPTYIHILIIYAFCRIDDLSWGTKGLEGGEDPKMAKIKKKNTKFKYVYVCKWIGIY